MTEEELTGSPYGNDTDELPRNPGDDDYDADGTEDLLTPDPSDEEAERSSASRR